MKANFILLAIGVFNQVGETDYYIYKSMSCKSEFDHILRNVYIKTYYHLIEGIGKVTKEMGLME